MIETTLAKPVQLDRLQPVPDQRIVPRAGDHEDYIPATAGDYLELQRQANGLEVEPVSINYEGDATYGYFTPSGERVADDIALLMKEKADPRTWVRDVATEELMLKAAKELERHRRVDLFGLRQRMGDKKLGRAEEVLVTANLVDDVGRLNAPLLRSLAGLSQVSRRQLEMQGVDVDKLVRERTRMIGKASVKGVVYAERVMGATPEQTLLNLLSDPRVNTEADIAGVLFPEQVGGTIVHGKLKLRHHGQLQGRQFDLNKLTNAQKAEVKTYVKKLEAVRGLERMARSGAKKNYQEGMPPITEIADTLYPPTRVDTEEGVRYRSQPIDRERQEVLDTVQKRLAIVRSEELARPRKGDALQRYATLFGERLKPQELKKGVRELGTTALNVVREGARHGVESASDLAASIPRRAWIRAQDVLHGRRSLRDYFRPVEEDGRRHLEPVRAGAAASLGVLAVVLGAYLSTKSGRIPSVPADVKMGGFDMSGVLKDAAQHTSRH